MKTILSIWMILAVLSFAGVAKAVPNQELGQEFGDAVFTHGQEQQDATPYRLPTSISTGIFVIGLFYLVALRK